MLIYRGMVIVCMMLAMLGCGGSEAPGEGAEGKPDPAGQNRDDDARVAEAIKSGSANARQWLERGDTMIWEGSKKETLELVDKVMAMGAVEVLAIDIEAIPEEWGKGQITNCFAIVLPADEAKRAAVFAALNKWALGDVELTDEEREEYTKRDTGQKHILIEFD